jgi:hypothetical protein
MTPAFNNRIKIDQMRQTLNAAGSSKHKSSTTAETPAGDNLDFKQMAEKSAPLKLNGSSVVNEAHLNAMNHTLNSKGLNLTEAIASATIE